MSQTYVPGYGYVDSNDPGTSGTVKKGRKPTDTGQNPDGWRPSPQTWPRFAPPPGPAPGTVTRLEFPTVTTSDVSSSDMEYRAQRAARMGMLPEDNKYTNEQYAQAAADVTNGYVIETQPGVYEVVYGIWAAQAKAQALAREQAIKSPEFKGAGNYGQPPGTPGDLPPGADAAILGSTATGNSPYIRPDRVVPDYSIFTDQSQIPQNAGLMNVDTYESLQAKGDGAAFGVYMGTFTQAGSVSTTATDVVKDARVVSDYTMLSDAEQKQVLDLTASYYSGMPWQFSWIEKRWAKAVTTANKRLMLYGEKVTPFEVYDRMIAHEAAMDAEKNASGGGGYGGYGGGGYGGGATQSTIRLTSPTDARVILNQAMRQYLGRDASGDEISKFVKLLNTQERANPIVQTFEGDTALQYGGFNPQTFAEDFARSQDGASEYGAATSFLDALIGALNGNTGVM